MTGFDLRDWQARFLDTLAAHRGEDFLLVACPAAGKTIAAGAAAATAMGDRGCDQLVVVAPTVIVRDQWQRELARLGFRLEVDFGPSGWPEHVHGVCATYAQVAQRAERYAQQLAVRETVVILDEVHHAGGELAWGAALQEAFASARLRLCLSGTPFRSDRDGIPFVTYDSAGRCVADFAYEYGRAVRDGVCRTISFRAHDGTITWLSDQDQPVTAAFSERVSRADRPRRLRACLDPSRPYLRSLLSAAHRDLVQMREQVPDAAGLVVCDSQAHALAIDHLVCEISGSLPTLAMSDVPRAHQAIAAFATDDEPWLVSVRMVSEGVDIPRLGVIVWATAASTELLVRQVAGRALRSRPEHQPLPAVVHMPADPELVRYAGRLRVLAGVSSRRDHANVSQSGRDKRWKGAHKVGFIDPSPFVEWFDKLAAGIGTEDALARCAWAYDAGTRRLHRWRREHSFAHPWQLFDACHMAGVSFDDLFDGPEYEDARAYVNDPLVIRERLDFRTVEATAAGAVTIEPLVKDAGGGAAPNPRKVQLEVPVLPPSPQELEDRERAREQRRGEVLKLLSIYAQLRGLVDHSYLLPSAHRELANDVGSVRTDSTDEHIAVALDWCRTRLAQIAAEHPAAVKELARRQRRLAIAGSL